jgi:aryl-alcohol dehydrogenase-like predicted oxidoreductase
MEYRNLGRTGLKVSELCLGSMQFGWTADEALSFQILTAAFESGINFIDTADIYSRWASGNPGGVSETIIGNWLRDYRISRDQIVIATKVRGRMGDEPDDEGLSYAHILKAVEASLRRLNTDYIDLYQAHWFDDSASIEETLTAFDALIQQGKVRVIGCSNYPVARLNEALEASRNLQLARYDTLQPHYNLVHRQEFEDGLAEVCQVNGLGVLPYSPLAGGFLSGKYHQAGDQPHGARLNSVRRYFTDRNWTLLAQIEDLARAKDGASVSQIALAWLLSAPLVTSPIIGPRSLEQLADNLGAAGIRLTAAEKSCLNQTSNWK